MDYGGASAIESSARKGGCGTVWGHSGEFTSPIGGVKPPLHQTVPLPKGDAVVRNKVRWGVLGAAQIAVQKVIPAMQRGEWSEISAIASRDRHKAEAAASALGITKAYGSY